MNRHDRDPLERQMSHVQPAPHRDGILILAMVGVFIAGLTVGGLLFTFGSNPSTSTASDDGRTALAFLFEWGRKGRAAIVPVAGMAFPICPQMLRHRCGYARQTPATTLEPFQAWRGHKNIQHTVRYTELAPDRFKDFWPD